jgi:hypothetical protein
MKHIITDRNGLDYEATAHNNARKTGGNPSVPYNPVASQG